MPNLLSSLISSGTALKAFDRVLEVTQNNVANASTPGYARQTQSLNAMPFSPDSGLVGGVEAGEVRSARSAYAEQAVRRQTVALGQAQQNVSSLTSLQALFDVSGQAGIATSLNDLFQSFSSWGESPSDAVARQTVVERATDVANSFRQTYQGLTDLSLDTERQLQDTVDQVNTLVGRLQTYNAAILRGSRNDAGLDAGVNSVLEELSGVVDFTAIQQADGSVTVLLNGQTPLLMGDTQYKIGYRLATPNIPPPDYPNGRPDAQILAADGSDVTAATKSGQLGALLDMHNRVLPSYIGNAYQAGDLNTMAKQFADRVNQLLTSGYVSEGPPPEMGSPLFTYDTDSDTNVAQTLAVDPTVTPDQLAAYDPGPPAVSNGIPLALSQLADPQDSADEINGKSYTQFYGDMTSRAGAELSNATNQVTVEQSMVAQAKALREQTSGVSLDEEAATLIQFQRAYEANSRLITVLSQLTEDVINILQP